MSQFFYLLDYVTCHSEKSGFQKKKKRRPKNLPDITANFFVFVSSEITEKIIISKHHSGSVKYIKNMINRVHVIFG